MNAVIYCRVSSREQVEGTSLESQESACREHARRHNLTVSWVFVEQGESAKFADRTQLLELLSYCKDKSRKIEVLLVWKVDRFARNVEDHYAIKAALRKLGVRVVSVTEPIEADPNGKLMETILAGFAQFDNDVRALRTVQGMQQRLREGVFPWKPPLGYIPPRTGKKTQPDQPDPRSFEPIQKAWRLFASGAYTKADILRLLRSWGVCAYRGGLVRPQLLDHLFRNPYYAGVLRDPWSGAEYPGRHAPMVSTAEFARVQQLISRRNNTHPHRRLHTAFPLRGLVRCPSCEQYMTSSFARGRRQRYPYYHCFRRDCATRTKSYSAASAHDDFSGFMVEMSIPDFLATPIVNEIVSASSEQTEGIRQAADRRRDEIKRIERQLHELISMRTAELISDQEFVVQRTSLREQLLELQASGLADTAAPLTTTEARELVKSLADLNAMWQETPLEEKHVFGELLFPAGYVHQRIRTAECGPLFKVFGMSEGGTSNVVAFIKANTNTIIAEIRRLLAIIRRRTSMHKEAV